ncbi:ribosomal protein uL30-like isoform X2 [Pseudophryne corroboree]|uniref:ribosomal protein uL30-like isoform X2 n=1 Tax=Pseudophryne corroboree TaxID=495146 RepID=UPI003081DCF7
MLYLTCSSKLATMRRLLGSSFPESLKEMTDPLDPYTNTYFLFSKDPQSLHRMLQDPQTVNWKQELQIQGCQPQLGKVLEEVSSTYGSKMHTTSNLLYMKDKTEEEELKNCTIRPRKLPRVPENLLKKRRKYQGLKAAEAKRALEEKRKVQPGKQIKFKRLETLVRNSRRKLRDDTRLRRMEIYNRGPKLANQKLAFVARIMDIQGVSPAVLRVLKNLRLGDIFSGTFVKLTPESVKMLQVVEPYVAWGFPNLKSVRELILKRGQTVVKGKKVPLTDNNMIEEQLGQLGIICLEDVIHELYSAGNHFTRVNRFLCPFQLSISRHAGVNRKGYITEVGDPGNRGIGINQLIRKLN